MPNMFNSICIEISNFQTNLVYKNECVFVCMFELYRRLNGGTDFLVIFTISSCMSGKKLLFMLIF